MSPSNTRNQSALEGDEYSLAALPSLTSRSEQDWLSIVREAYDTSTDFFDTNHRKQIERNVSMFRGVHPAGSKYHTDAYRARTRMFRPKLRSAERKAEAAFASALFQNTDIIQIEPINNDDKAADEMVEVWEALLTHTLRHQIPWYLLSVGAFQKAQVDGICISKQEWEYRDRVDRYTEVNEFGEEFQRLKREVLENKPIIRLVEIENIRFDAGADWTDPLNTSPYLIEIIPMYVSDVLAYIDIVDEREGGRQPWIRRSKEELCRANRDFMGNRISKKQGETDPADQDYAVKEFELIFVFRNIFNVDGGDVEFYSVGHKLLLSEPVPLYSPIGRGYRAGVTNIEAHRVIPASAMELGQALQAEANDIANLRMDNVKLAMNRRKIVQRGRGTDLAALTKFRPGSIVLTDDINAVKEEDNREVHSSAFAEQDRLNMDIDDIVGGFSTSSVASNRALNQTVGGMQLMNNAANAQTEFVIRTFVETWVEPVLTDLVKLMQAYEDIEVIKSFAVDKQQRGVQSGPLPQQLPGKQQDDSLDIEVMKAVKVSVTVGFGNLDPKLKIQGLTQTLQALAAFSPGLIARLDEEALGREVFSAIGFRNGKKFFKDDAVLQQQQQQGSPEQAAQAVDAQIAMKRLELDEMRLQADIKLKEAEIASNREKWMAEIALKNQLTMGQLQGKLGLDADRLNLDIIKEMSNQEKIKRDREEMQLRLRTGAGI